MAGASRLWADAQVREGAVIGPGCEIGTGSFIGRDVEIGANTIRGAGVLVYQGARVGSEPVIETLCILANQRVGPDRRELIAARVGSQSHLGPRSIIHAGVRVGDRGRTADGAVVAEDLPDGGMKGSTWEPPGSP